VALRSSAFLIGMPITPNIIQTMKHTVKASVLTISTDQAFLSLFSSEAMSSFSTRGMARLSAHGEKLPIRRPVGRDAAEER